MILNIKKEALLYLGIILTLLFGIPGELDAQQRSFSTLPLVNAGEVVVNEEGNLNDEKEYQHVFEIYNNLVEARGDYRMPVPSLMIKDVEGYVASMDYSVNEITLEKKAYDAIKKYGDSGIAFLLGHELTHYYEKHAWKGAFADEISDLKLGDQLKEIQDEVEHETEADYLGGFLAYTAGYGMFDKGGQIISELYKAYRLGDQLEGYPIKSDRIELSDRSAVKMQSLVDAFDMGNMLYTIGYEKDALLYYKYVLNYYQSAQLYNNLGTMSLIAAIQKLGKRELKFTYPTELDIDLRPTRGDNTYKEILNNAILFLNSAINLNPNYAPAYLNKANAYALLGELKKASFYLEEEALPIAKKDPKTYAKTIEDIWVLRGIIASRNGDNNLAKKYLNKAKELGSNIAIENLKVLDALISGRAISLSSGSNNNETLDFTNDKIGALSINTYLTSRPKVDNNTEIHLEQNCAFFRYTPDQPGSKVFLHKNPDRKYNLAFLTTTNDYKGQTTKGVKIGSPESHVLALYGDKMKSLETVQGRILIYPTILFFIDDDRVIRWSTYKMRKARF